MTSFPRAAAMCLLAVVALSGCGRSTPPAPTSEPADADSPTSVPVEPTRPSEPPSGGRLAPLSGSEPDVRWTPNGFEVLAFGSSSCPPVATSVDVVDDSSVVIDVQPEEAGACTDDLAPHNSFVAAPDGLHRKEPLEVRLRDESGLGEAIRVEFLDNTLM